MPDPQSPLPAGASSAPALLEVVPVFDDSDFALGCECADPALQIAHWGQEVRVPDGN